MTNLTNQAGFLDIARNDKAYKQSRFLASLGMTKFTTRNDKATTRNDKVFFRPKTWNRCATFSQALEARNWQTRWMVSRWPSFKVRNSNP